MMPNPSNSGWPINQQQQWMHAGQVMGWGAGNGAVPFPFINQPAQQFIPGPPVWNSNQWQQWNVPNPGWGQVHHPPANAVFPQQPYSAPLPPQEPPFVPVPLPPLESMQYAQDSITEEEKQFDVQFADWESKFRAWKEENKNHPDKKALTEYEAQWEGWRQQLLQKRDQMRKQREETREQLKAANSQGAPVWPANPVQSVHPQIFPQSFNIPDQMPPVNSAMHLPENQPQNFNVVDFSHHHHGTGQTGQDFDGRRGPADEDFRHRRNPGFDPPAESNSNRPLFPGMKRPELESDGQNGQYPSRKRPRSGPANDRGISEGLINRLLRQSGSIDPSDTRVPPIPRAKSPARFQDDEYDQDRIQHGDIPFGAHDDRVGGFAPIVKDYSNARPTNVMPEPVVFDYYHLPGRFGQYCSANPLEDMISFDYYHGRGSSVTAEGQRPPVDVQPSAAPPHRANTPEEPIKKEVVAPVASPVPPPVPKASSTQLFPSAAAIEHYNSSNAARLASAKNNGQDKIENQGHSLNPATDLQTSGTPIPSTPAPVAAPVETVKVEDLLQAPGRQNRSSQVVVILRGLPGSGKSHVARLVKEKEVALGGSAPRILSIDDYFMMDDGVPPVWSSELEEQYRQNLVKSFKRNLDDGHFPFIIVDSLNLKESDLMDLVIPARMRGFGVYLVELPPASDRPGTTRKCSDQDMQTMKKRWETAPASVTRLDIQWLLNPPKDEPKDPNEVSPPEKALPSTTTPADDDSQSSSNGGDAPAADGDPNVSRWEMMEQTEEKLDRLDGIVKRLSGKRDKPATLEDWLQLPDDYDQRKSADGKKRVRWADIEEKNQQEKMRAVGFVVGQTDWSRMTDPTFGESALTQTKYI